MKQFFKDLFNDSNTINEKAVIGFISFIVMIIFAIADVSIGFLCNKQMLINESIFDAFKWITIACFGIASVDKYINKTNDPQE
jgi:hypothetical protein